MRLVVSIASILLTAAPALAANITLGPQKPDRPNVVMVEGLLVADDEEQFAAKTASLPSAFVAFSSDGGSLMAGLRMGEAIRRKGFSTIVPDGQRCAPACALAWLGGVERFIGTDGKIGFHAGYDWASDGDIGIGNTVVSAYLAKIGLSYQTVIYITQTAPNEMTWLNMSDAAQRGIRVTLLSSLAKETIVAIPTRYGDVTVTRDDPDCCGINIRYGNQVTEIASTDQIFFSTACRQPEEQQPQQECSAVIMTKTGGVRLIELVPDKPSKISTVPILDAPPHCRRAAQIARCTLSAPRHVRFRANRTLSDIAE
jgi:hypothetical protein